MGKLKRPETVTKLRRPAFLEEAAAPKPKPGPPQPPPPPPGAVAVSASAARPKLTGAKPWERRKEIQAQLQREHDWHHYLEQRREEEVSLLGARMNRLEARLEAVELEIAATTPRKVSRVARDMDVLVGPEGRA